MKTHPQQVFVQQAPYGDRDAIAAGVEALFAQLSAVERLTPQSRVLLKPNLLAKHAPEKAVTTHPHVVRGVILALQKRGVIHITLADSPGGLYTPGSIAAIYEACGLAEVCRELDVELYTGCESAEKAGPGSLVKNFTLLRPVLESNFIINLPKLKTHVLTGMSGAVKNLFGCVPGMGKPEFHARFPAAQHFGQMLVDLCETVNADIHLVDGVRGMEGDGPSGGEARDFNLLLAGENPYTLDLAIARYMGLPTKRLPVVLAAQRSGLCPQAFEESLLVGSEAAKQPLPGFAPPRSYDGPLTMMVSMPKPVQWAFNALSGRLAPRPVIRRAACIGCGKCAEICPQNVIRIEAKKARIDYTDCIRCFCCHEMCPVKAIDVRRSALFRRTS